MVKLRMTFPVTQLEEMKQGQGPNHLYDATDESVAELWKVNLSSISAYLVSCLPSPELHKHLSVLLDRGLDAFRVCFESLFVYFKALSPSNLQVCSSGLLWKVLPYGRKDFYMS